MKKILLIGGCGYIGSALYEKLNKKYQLDTVDLEWFGNFTNTKNIKEDFVNLTEEFLDRYDVIVFTAANSSVPLCKDVFDTFDNNVAKFVSLVKKLNKQKFIYASSSCVYVTSDNTEKVETDELNPLDGLTLSKTTIDHFMNLTNIEYYGLRFGSVNGWAPNMRLDLMLNAMTISAKENSEVNVFNGHAHRPILSINDLCRAVETIIECKEDNRGIYNVASFNNNIMDIGKNIADYIGVKINDNGKNFTYDFKISSEKFIKQFDFKFTDTIQTIVESILSNSHNKNWSKRENK
jgi:nucleoside-diphosphate-sugar epimerase